MSERLSRALDNIRSDAGVTRLDEASVRQVVVLQILDALDWNQFNRAEVTPEFAVGDGRVDYRLQAGGRSRVFIEVKRGGEALSPHQGQLLRYSFERGVSLAALTNGLEWWFYLPLREGSWEERRFSDIDIMSEDRSNVEAVLFNVLCKDRVASGSAIEFGEDLLERRRRERIVNQNLPKAWDLLVSEPDELLVELLAEQVERISNISPDSSLVRSFILETVAKSPGGRLAEPSLQARRTPVRSSESAHRSEPKAQAGNAHVSTPTARRRNPTRKLTGFRFQGESIQVSDLYGLLQKLSEIIYLRHSSEFDSVLQLYGTRRDGSRRDYYSMNRELVDAPKPVGNSGYYVDTKFGIDAAVRQCHKILRLFGYQDQDLEVEINHFWISSTEDLRVKGRGSTHQ